MGYEREMNNPKVSDLVIQICATVIAAGIVGLFAQGIGVFRRLAALESSVKEIRETLNSTHAEFHESHHKFEDGEYHHRRGSRV